jgi:hypothetical protein
LRLVVEPHDIFKHHFLREWVDHCWG